MKNEPKNQIRETARKAQAGPIARIGQKAHIGPICAIALAAVLVLPGCERHAANPTATSHATPEHSHEHEHAASAEHAHEHEEASATFDKTHGLSLTPEAIEALNLRTAKTTTRSFVRQVRIVARNLGDGRAIALVSPELAAALRLDTPVTLLSPAVDGTAPADSLRLLAISNETEKASGRVELVFESPPAPTTAPAADTSLTLVLSLAPVPALAVPRSALLDAASGTFVYLVRDGHYLRTPVKTGTADSTHIEIISGLAADAVVLETAVEQLWLTELRLTKGGGHSH